MVLSSLLRSAMFGCLLGFGLAHAQPWQQSLSPVLQLGLRSKFGETTYEAEFVVTGPAGKSWHKRVLVQGDAFARVVFPDDFDGDLTAGKYTWRARVKGTDVVRGAFAVDQMPHRLRVTTEH